MTISDSADIEFGAAPNLSDYYTGYRPHLASARSVAVRRRSQPGGLLPALWRGDADPLPSLLPVTDESAPGAPEGSAGGDEDANENGDDPDGDYGAPVPPVFRRRARAPLTTPA